MPTTAPAPQPEFDYLIGHFRPTLTLEESGSILVVGPDAVEALVDEGTLLAVDIASPDATQRRLRIWRYTVVHRAIRPEAPLQPLALADLLTHGRPTWTLSEVGILLRCSDPHVITLWDHDDCPLTGPNYNAGRPGKPAKSRKISRESLIQFLTTTAV